MCCALPLRSGEDLWREQLSFFIYTDSPLDFSANALKSAFNIRIKCAKGFDFDTPGSRVCVCVCVCVGSQK